MSGGWFGRPAKSKTDAELDAEDKRLEAEPDNDEPDE